MLVDDKSIQEIIMRISKHYNANIATRFLRPLFARILSDTDLARHIVNLTEHSDDVILQGVHIDDLYYDIIAMARFIFLVKRDILSNIYSLTEESVKTSTSDRVYRNMAFSNLEPNIDWLAGMVQELYDATLAYDKRCTKKTGKTVASKIKDLSEISRLLTGSSGEAST
ncbi:MAG: hypothetical protein ACTTJ7_02095 [Treponema sp.]